MSSFRKAGDHVTRSIAGETIVVPIRARAADLDSLFVFNDSGAAIWTWLDSPRSAEELAQALADEFEVSGDSAHADVLRFLELLQGAGLIESQPTP